MKLSIKVVLFLTILINAQQTIAQGVDAYFDYAAFNAPGIGPYVETYIAFAGNSMHYVVNNDSMLQASAEVTLVFKNVEDVKEFRKYQVLGPALPDTATIFHSFIDLQRIVIPNGVYNFELYIHDNYGPDTVPDYKQTELVSVNIPKDELSFSGIQFLERFISSEEKDLYNKSGYKCIPYVSDFFPKQMNFIRFYCEIYNAAKELGPLEDFLVLFHIESSNTSKPIKEFSSFQKQTAQNVNAIIKEINISDLPTGNYYLVMELRDRENQLKLVTKKFFQRSNPGLEIKPVELAKVSATKNFASSFINKDSLAFYLNALRPICDPSEERFIDNQLSSLELPLMQQFFYTFWVKRESIDPAKAWKEYKVKLDEVQLKFGTKLHPGFTTDRGRIYLQYGPPNSVISEQNESDAYPYEIWHYYNIADQTNKKFIFYNRDLTGKDYILLHSNMKGELNNPNWQRELYSRTDNNGMINTSKAKQYFDGE